MTQASTIALSAAGRLTVPDHPIIPYIEGDGIGPDIWRATRMVLDAAVENAYGGSQSIAWKEGLAGEKAYNATGEWLPRDTVGAIQEYHVAIKGPLTTPVGGGRTGARRLDRCFSEEAGDLRLGPPDGRGSGGELLGLCPSRRRQHVVVPLQKWPICLFLDAH